MLIPVNFLKGVSVPQASPTFDFTINTTLVSTGSSAANQYKLPLIIQGSYNMTVYWGDGTSNFINFYNQPEILHTYATPGIYNIVISGTCMGWRNSSSGADRAKLLNISNWGETFTFMAVSTNSSTFYNNINLSSITATDTPKLTTSMISVFRGCNNLVTINNIENWDVSGVINMSYLFNGCYLWNDNINNWDTSNVINMFRMFQYAESFNQPLNNWNVSSVTNMGLMFSSATSFNQDINSWDVSSVVNMQNMFDGAGSFNQPLNNWDTSSVTSMNGMFSATTVFNQPLNNWNTSNVQYMGGMFVNASSFNQNINNWDTSSVTDMSGMFQAAIGFNQPLNNWNVSSVQDMSYMFNSALAFNQPLNNWDVSSVSVIQEMFAYATSFNSSVAGWNFTSIIYDYDFAFGLENMFLGATSFNQPINTWTNFENIYNTGGMFEAATSFNQELPVGFLTYVYEMNYMFQDATAFNQSLSNQEPGISGGFYAENFIWSTSLTSANLSTMYNSWLLNYTNTSVPDPFPYGSTFIVDTQYTAAGEVSRNTLIDDYGWTIIDGGLA